MIKILIAFTILLLVGPAQSVPGDIVMPDPSWIYELEQQFGKIEQNMSGNLGVFVKHLGDNQSLSYKADHNRYLASTTKIPLAIAVLQKVEAGELSLNDELTLMESDFVDGSGDLLWQKPGTNYTIAALIARMIQNSDNCATDMLFRLFGEEEINLRIRQTMIPEGFNRMTSILQVRHDAFSEFHENAYRLTNMDILYVNSTRSQPERVTRLMNRLAVNEDEMKVKTLSEAFERYYERQLNSGNLESMGLLLERLYRGELLSEKHTGFLLEIMGGVTTGDRRIKAGLAEGYHFATKREHRSGE
jgi:beta-lactamase class A